MVIQITFMLVLSEGILSTIAHRTEKLCIRIAHTDVVKVAAAVDAAAIEGVPTGLLLAVIEHESKYRPKARNGKDCGPMQVRPSTITELRRRGRHFSLHNLNDNVRAGAAYLKLLHNRYRKWPMALTAYNKGSAGLKADGYRVSRYAKRVMARWKAIDKVLISR